MPTTVLAWSQVSTMDAFDADSNGQHDDSDDNADNNDDDTITIIRQSKRLSVRAGRLIGSVTGTLSRSRNRNMYYQCKAAFSFELLRSHILYISGPTKSLVG